MTALVGPTVQVGAAACTLLSDGVLPFDEPLARGFLFAAVDPDELTPALAPYLGPGGVLPTATNSVLVRTDGPLVLVDGGLGAEVAAAQGMPTGRLAQALAAADVDPAEVDLVIASHGHLDHVGGLVAERDGEQAPVYPRARHLLHRSEWDFWFSRDAEALGDMAKAVRPRLSCLHEAGLVDLVDGQTEVAPGVHILPAPGHTPGHVAVSVQGDGEQLLYLGDAVVHELNLEHPDWLSAVDVLADQTRSTRRQLLDRAAVSGAVVVAYHVGRTGRVERSGAGYRFAP